MISVEMRSKKREKSLANFLDSANDRFVNPNVMREIPSRSGRIKQVHIYTFNSWIGATYGWVGAADAKLQKHNDKS